MTATEPSTAVDLATGEIVNLGERLHRLTPAEAAQWSQWVRQVTREALIEDTDYGTIPGTERDTLYKSGAEKLIMFAVLGVTVERTEVETLDGRKHGVYYKATVHGGDRVLAECEGYAGYDEDRFYKSAADAEARERANASRYQRPVKTPPQGWQDYRAPWNSVIKMAQKRAYVGATLNALAASGLFTQDLEDEQTVAGQDQPPAKPGTEGWAREAGWDTLSNFEASRNDMRQHLKALVKDGIISETEGADFWRDYQHPDPTGPAMPRTRAEHRAFDDALRARLSASQDRTAQDQPAAGSAPQEDQEAPQETDQGQADGPTGSTPENGPSRSGATGAASPEHADNGFRDRLDELARQSVDVLIPELAGMDIGALELALDRRGHAPDPAEMPSSDELRRRLGGIIIRNMTGGRPAVPAESDLPDEPERERPSRPNLPVDNGHRGTSERTLVEKGPEKLAETVAKMPHAALVKALDARGYKGQWILTTDTDDTLRQALIALTERNVENDRAFTADPGK